MAVENPNTISLPPFRALRVEDRVILFFESEDDAILFESVTELAKDGTGRRVIVTVEAKYE